MAQSFSLPRVATNRTAPEAAANIAKPAAHIAVSPVAIEPFAESFVESTVAESAVELTASVVFVTAVVEASVVSVVSAAFTAVTLNAATLSSINTAIEILITFVLMFNFNISLISRPRIALFKPKIKRCYNSVNKLMAFCQINS